MQSISLKKAVELLGGKNIELRSNYMEQTGFFEKDDQLYYICSGDIRMRKDDGQLNVMYRTAKNRKDFVGGINQWNFNRIINEMGYRVDTCRVKY